MKNTGVKYLNWSKLNNLVILILSSEVSCLQGGEKVNNMNWKVLIISPGCCWNIVCAWFGLPTPSKRLFLVSPPFVKRTENTIKLKVFWWPFFPIFKVFSLNLNKCYLSRFPSLQDGYFMPRIGLFLIYFVRHWTFCSTLPSAAPWIWGHSGKASRHQPACGAGKHTPLWNRAAAPWKHTPLWKYPLFLLPLCQELSRHLAKL